MMEPAPLQLPSHHLPALQPYLPIARLQTNNAEPAPLPHLTLTYAAALDSAIALAPGQQTRLSGLESHAMTHYLRAHHDAILVGSGTALCDNPRLLSQWEGAQSQPRPVILDPSGRWLAHYDGTDHLTRLARTGAGHPPWVVVDSSVLPGFLNNSQRICELGGRILTLNGYQGRTEGLDWAALLEQMAGLGIRSLMVEGGSHVINDLLRGRNQRLISSVIVTVAPTYLGIGGVVVSPQRDAEAAEACRLRNVRWLAMGEDAVMAGHLGVPK